MTERELNAQIAALSVAYDAAVAKHGLDVTEPMSEKIMRLKALLSALLSDGADDCPNCKTKPHGMHKGKGTYEVGCLGCDLRARAESPQDAVEDWNAGKYSTAPKGISARVG